MAKHCTLQIVTIRYNGGNNENIGKSSSHSGSGGGNSDSRNGSGKTTTTCPKCGDPCLVMQPFAYSNRFVKCNSCNHLFLLQNDSQQQQKVNDERAKAKPPEEMLKKPPPPRKIYDYLCRYIVGQERAKRILSVAVYNHYKRLYFNNLPVLSKPAFDKQNWKQKTDGTKDQGNLMQIRGRNATQTNQLQQETPINGTDLLDNNISALKLEKSNIVLFGPTGKTLLAQTLARCLDVPFAICDCTTLTQAGYVGEDIESVIGKLLQDANYNVSRAQQGIVFLDEVDKIGCVPGIHQLRDVGGEGVQQGLLKMLEGSIVNVPEKSLRKMRGDANSFAVDTTHILFVASGAFNGLDRVVSRRKHKKFLGFGAPSLQKLGRRAAAEASLASDPIESSIEDLKERDLLLSDVEAQDMIDFGLIPEFVGRFPVLCHIESLDEEALMRILTEPENALLRQYKALFEMDKVQLAITDGACLAIAKMALQKKTGARGLRSIMERLLLDSMFEVPGSDIVEIIIDEDVVNGRKSPVYISDSSQASKPSTEESDNQFSDDIVSENYVRKSADAIQA
ncbi:uncharacterized protein TRIADDRAFT_50037 [Trichoplax adhaerens]|uniref:ClpX-type ZB domain-containing protein n=1 Tax=Trichoplax adhaerens TaxID=10228 RepID=B3RSC2_TRIAD|nr:hypothetical protein TRIADDRAFT_50037 [Trichoplax adhaerens]EDV26489.1 hypothetical protein TRIADDRAFT_50037 [Trichoplax adhaerens]|eukprot:XP_002110485.1 hypothetical protein TRIADDRAFT_50037 [Trichoplax adhaerens]